ncbi:uncharacterized protein N7506_009146 [Penicillium brevicompactum]|uniref:uncharacterized protein n=1 Tax=Penicillium brevicompactum TaxID=5074 RepID=UPI002541A7AB|nr:uncharacterized protein N7506_009146 [Penicillium brevicompactum]KAJ5326044.1 hypothetical protein N7506_009146 [Penicillium brevicompactum]
MADDESIEETKQTLIQRFRAWGVTWTQHELQSFHTRATTDVDVENSFPPTLLASLIAAQHMKPFQFFPMLFPPALLFTSYANLQGFKTDTAGMSAAWSGLYLLLAARRRQPFVKKFGVRGVVRGATMGLALVNMVGGGLAYTLGKREGGRERVRETLSEERGVVAPTASAH